MDIKLIAFDLDGTLLRDDKTFSERNKEALYQVAQKGIYLVPATGRTYEGMPEEIRRLPFLRYMIGTNGAFVYDIKEQKILHRAELGQEESARIFAYMEKLPAVMTCYQNGKGWIEAACQGLIEEYAPCPEQVPFMKRVFTPVENMKEKIFEFWPTTQKLQVFFKEQSERDRYLAEMRDLFPDYTISYALSNNIEVNAPDANKGNALKFLCDYLKIDRSESMAIGDGMNDMNMIRQAGIGVAMGNAEEAILKAADCVTAVNNEDGVAVMIEKVLQEMG